MILLNCFANISKTLMMNDKIVIPIKRYYMLIAIFDSAFLLYGLSAFTKFQDKDFIEILIDFLILLILFFYAIWYTFGKEEISFSEDHIKYKKVFGPIALKRNYFYENISGLENKVANEGSSIEQGKNYIKEMRRAFPFWYNMGRIRFRYKNRFVTILNGIENLNQGEEIIRQLGNVSD